MSDEGVVTDVFVQTDDRRLTECFHADIAKLFVQVPEETVSGSKLANGVWEHPAPLEPEEEPDPLLNLPPLTPMAFYLAFTAAERIAIKSSQDAVVQEFWATWQLANQTMELIHPSRVSVRGAVEYLRHVVGILQADERIEQVLRGIPQ